MGGRAKGGRDVDHANPRSKVKHPAPLTGEDLVQHQASKHKQNMRCTKRVLESHSFIALYSDHYGMPIYNQTTHSSAAKSCRIARAGFNGRVFMNPYTIHLNTATIQRPV